MGTALCSSPGAVFGRVLFSPRVSLSSTIGFLENFSAMFLGMVVGEVAFLTIVSTLLFARLTSILSQILSSTHWPPHTAWTWQSPGPGWLQPPWSNSY